MVLFVLQHGHLPRRTAHIIEHKASSYQHNIAHRFSIVIYTLPNSGTRFIQCRELITTTATIIILGTKKLKWLGYNMVKITG